MPPITRELLEGMSVEELRALQAKATGQAPQVGATGETGSPIVRGIKGAIRAFPRLATEGKLPTRPLDSDFESFRRKERTKLELKREFAEPKKITTSNLVESAKTKLLKPDATVEDLTQEERGALEFTKTGRDILATKAKIAPSKTFEAQQPTLRGHLASAFSSKKAILNKATQEFLNSGQIQTQQDLDELVERKAEAEIKGIDVDAILEAFGQR